MHGFAVDESGQKMSKSIGNVTHPSDIIDKYGVDTLRWFVGFNASSNASVAMKTNALIEAAENVGKLRRTLKFLIGFIDSKAHTTKDLKIDLKKLTYFDKYFLDSLAKFDLEVSISYDERRQTYRLTEFPFRCKLAIRTTTFIGLSPKFLSWKAIYCTFI